MKRAGILHPDISHLLASTGHTDYFTICDRGFPVPLEPERIDLALVEGIPTVLDVLRAVHAEFVIDRIVVAEEAALVSADHVAALKEIVGTERVMMMSHLALKELSRGTRATIRTGDATPYANIIVVSG